MSSGSARIFIPPISERNSCMSMSINGQELWPRKAVICNSQMSQSSIVL